MGILKYIIVMSVFMLLLISCKKEELKKDYDNFEFEELLGSKKDSIIEEFGVSYEEVKQGVNNQNQGLYYGEIGITIGLDQNDIVIEVQLINGPIYNSLTSNLTMQEAYEIIGEDALKINFNPGYLWYVYDYGNYRLRISGVSNGAKIDEIVITKEDFKISP